MTFTLSGELVVALLINVALLAAAYGSLRQQVTRLARDQEGAAGLSNAVTQLQTEVKHLREDQPRIIAAVVSASIRETLRLAAPRLMQGT